MCPDRRKEIERWLTESELDERLATADGELLRRLIFVKNLYYGDTVADAAGRVGRSESTGDRWATAWNRDGVAALAPTYGGGRPAKLDDRQREQLQDRLQEGEPWQSAAVRRLLDTEFGVTFHPNYLPTFLRELGLVYVPASARPADEKSGWIFD